MPKIPLSQPGAIVGAIVLNILVLVGHSSEHSTIAYGQLSEFEKSRPKRSIAAKPKRTYVLPFPFP